MEFGGQQQGFEQILDPGPLESRNPNHFRIAAPFRGKHVVLRQIGENLLLVDVRQVHLVHRDDDRHTGRLRVADTFNGLRHDAVVRGDDQHDDVGDVRTTGTHFAKGRVTGAYPRTSASCLRVQPGRPRCAA